METPKEKASYCIGLEAGKNITQQFSDLDLDILVKGFQDAVFNAPIQLEMDEIRSVLQTLRRQVEIQQREYLRQMAIENRKTGAEFLEANKTKEGVVSLPSGLQYRIVHSGHSGRSPTMFDTVALHFTGSFIDGRVFETTSREKQAATFPMGQVIPGWAEALQLMQEGDCWELFVPSYLAHGEHGLPNRIAPNTTLVFKMELVAINPAPVTR